MSGRIFAYSALLLSSRKTGALVPAAIILAGTNICVNYVLVFGKLGFPVMGMRGAALGSLAAEAAAFLFLTIYVLRAFDKARYKLFRFHGLERKTLRLLGRLSAPIVVQNSLETLRWLAFFLIFERVSQPALAIATLFTLVMCASGFLRKDSRRLPARWSAATWEEISRNESEIFSAMPSAARWLRPFPFSQLLCWFPAGSLRGSLPNRFFSWTAAPAFVL